MGAKSENDVHGEDAVEVTLEELQEFLEADQHGVSARPEFKERLREKLWDLVQTQRRRWRRERS